MAEGRRAAAAAAATARQAEVRELELTRRTKSPEYALFMLNRQAVKNVTIPLVPGEMKATAIDASMLQVARRGEKIRYGIWFTDANDVPRFRDTIVRICGEPVKPPPGSTSTSTSTAGAAATAVAPFHPPNHAVAPYNPQAQQQQEDGLSRLFAGLTTVPAGSGGPSPQPTSPLPSDPAIYNARATPQRTSPGQGQNAQPQPRPHGQARDASPPQQPQQQQAHFAPGQTVDDLLRGILGPAPPQAQPPAPAPPQAPPHAQAPPQAPPQFTSPPPTGPPLGPPPGPPPGPPNGFFAPGAIRPPPPPVVARDALADALPPPPAGPGTRDQLRDMVAALLREDRFVDDVWRAYCARTGRPA